MELCVGVCVEAWFGVFLSIYFRGIHRRTRRSRPIDLHRPRRLHGSPRESLPGSMVWSACVSIPLLVLLIWPQGPTS